ncbi:MAG TPA: protein-L-isoaspartate(D-aspartate) O-methyltransferase [Nevskiaceae bacterium]|nr:protein-L-isoaspartate(D-aspartate) O-methyltransferase [Nevskiaceae bacterium]
MRVLRPPSGPAATLDSQRRRLLDELRTQGIKDERVLGAIAKVPREQFIEEALRSRAYENNALPIGQAQTISQPYVVALMTQAILAGKQKLARVLEIGTGCGYQTAVLAELVPAVFTIERLKRLSEQARERLARLHYHKIHFSYSDGNAGWPTYAPFDAILVTAAAEKIPQPLIDQLAPGGRLVIPVGPLGFQNLKQVERGDKGVRTTDLCGVSFVPLLSGRA